MVAVLSCEMALSSILQRGRSLVIMAHCIEKKIQLKCRIITFKCRYNVGIEEDTQGEERGGGCSLLLMLHISLLQLIMTRLLFDAGEPLFIFL